MNSYYSGSLNTPASNAIPMNKNNKITITKTSTNATAYVNGIKYNTVTFANAIGITPASKTLVINGRAAVAGLYQFRGKIYSVRVYNRALTESEVIHNNDIDSNRYGVGI